MKVRKENRVLTVNEADKAFYLSQGYEVVEFNENTKVYDVVAKATGGRTYTIAEYNAVADELEIAKEKITLLQEKLIELTPNEFDREAAKAKLTELGVEFKGNVSNDNLKKLLDDATKEDGQ